MLVAFDAADRPHKRYVSGKLHSEEEDQEEPQIEDEDVEVPDHAKLKDNKVEGDDWEPAGDDPILGTNRRERTSFGMTFRVRKGEVLKVIMRCAIYEKQDDLIQKLQLNPNGGVEETGTPCSWWRRKPLVFEWQPTVEETTWTTLGQAGSHQVFMRLTKRREENGVVTVSLTATNKTKKSSDRESEVLYQCELEVEASVGFEPLRERLHRVREEDEQLMDLLYRNNTLHAMGHGCAVTWHRADDGTVNKLTTDFVPVHSIPAVVPRESKSGELDLAMYNLWKGDAGAIREMLTRLIDQYEAWVSELEGRIPDLDRDHRPAATNNLGACRKVVKRMRKGLELLEDKKVLECFRWMNHAMLWQQQRSKVGQRNWTDEPDVVEPITNGEQDQDLQKFRALQAFHNDGRGRWRPFQLAFVLMNLPAMWDPKEYTDDRAMVDLIWFPTGGGKTEAYLGLMAFTLFARRRTNERREDRYGTTALMRYTLRLLTTQQFERAASLIVACDLIRKENRPELSAKIPFSIGLLVGSSNTPTTNDDAVIAFNNNEYKFALLKCPCCGARFGKRGQNQHAELKGLRHGNNHIAFRCYNANCETHGQDLPIHVVNEQIYEQAPSLVVGTVDMFAQIPWKSTNLKQPWNGGEFLSRLFGFRNKKDGSVCRIKPPELIIQDELHLISGPLGSMVGMYETLVQELCTDHGLGDYPFHPQEGDERSSIPPKIVASSATITRASNQVKGLYGKTGENALQIFPPQGLDIGETWFSQVDRDHMAGEHAHLHTKGRWYVGLCPSISGLSAVYRSYGTVLAKHRQLANGAYPNDGRAKALDYYHTLIGFYNSIKELGRSNTMLAPGGNVPEYMGTHAARELIPGIGEELKTRELYSLNSAEQIQETLKELEANGEVDACLATNMIATGLDVPRLGLMFIHGQPKTTAEYIQASSRVGRQYWEGPGLVFTHYNGMKPRDMSIFEHFSSYHERIYAHVEPTSVTPYSIRVREKGIHAIFHGLVRHYSKNRRSHPGTIDDNLAAYIKEVIRDRASIILEGGNGAIAQVDEWLDRLIHDAGNLRYYGGMANMSIRKSRDRRKETAMMAEGSPVTVPDADRTYCLPTAISMRTVDREASVRIHNSI